MLDVNIMMLRGYLRVFHSRNLVTRILVTRLITLLFPYCYMVIHVTRYLVTKLLRGSMLGTHIFSRNELVIEDNHVTSSVTELVMMQCIVSRTRSTVVVHACPARALGIGRRSVSPGEARSGSWFELRHDAGAVERRRVVKFERSTCDG